jgi:hypothetical protein
LLLVIVLGGFLGLTVGVRFLMVAANVSCKYAGTCLSNALEFVFACAIAGLFSISLAYCSSKYVYENRAKLRIWKEGTALLVVWTFVFGIAALLFYWALIAPGNLIEKYWFD